MPRSRVDKSITRIAVEGVPFPLGVYPVEDMKPRVGYTIHFEQADGDDGEWEEWPDRYVFDIFVAATRVETMVRMLFSLLPGRIYPILDVLGQDEYREIDPYVAYELVSQERFQDAIRRHRGFFFEDGLVGFGAMSEEPFVYVFVDEHKIVTVRVEAALRERVEALLTAFDLTPVDEIAGADAATHEHRTVLDAPENRPDLLTVEEVVEELRDDWGLVINIDPESNVDDDSNELGITAWRCIARHEVTEPGDPAGKLGQPVKGESDGESEGGAVKFKGEGDGGGSGGSGGNGDGNGATHAEGDSGGTAGGGLRSRTRYAEIYLAAESISGAERVLWEAMEQLTGKERAPDAVDTAVSLDRLRPETLSLDLESLGVRKKGDPAIELDEPRVIHARWLE